MGTKREHWIREEPGVYLSEHFKGVVRRSLGQWDAYYMGRKDAHLANWLGMCTTAENAMKAVEQAYNEHHVDEMKATTQDPERETRFGVLAVPKDTPPARVQRTSERAVNVRVVIGTDAMVVAYDGLHDSWDEAKALLADVAWSGHVPKPEKSCSTGGREKQLPPGTAFNAVLCAPHPDEPNKSIMRRFRFTTRSSYERSES